MSEIKEEMINVLLDKNETEIFNWFETFCTEIGNDFKKYVEMFENYYLKCENELMEFNFIPITREESKLALQYFIEAMKNGKKFEDIIKEINIQFDENDFRRILINSINKNQLNKLHKYLNFIIQTKEKDFIVYFFGIYIDDIQNFDSQKKFAEIKEKYNNGYIEIPDSYKSILEKDEKDLTKEEKASVLKFYRLSNLKQKKSHTLRVVYLTNELIKKYDNISPTLKMIILVSALYHDLGRFYQGAFYSSFADAELCNLEQNNAYGLDEIKDVIDHAFIGYYISLNSMIDFNLESNGSNYISDVVSYIVKFHQVPISRLPYLDYRITDKENFCPQGWENKANTILESLYSEASPMKIIKGAFELFGESWIQEMEFRSMLKNLEGYLSIDEKFFELLTLELSKPREENKTTEQVIKEFLCQKYPHLNEEVLSKIIQTFYEYSEYRLSRDYDIAQKIDDYLKNNENSDLNKIIGFVFSVITDIDKTDIFIQLVNCRLDDAWKEHFSINVSLNEVSNFFENIIGIKLNEKEKEDIEKYNINSTEGYISIPKCVIDHIAYRLTISKSEEEKRKFKRNLILNLSLPQNHSKFFIFDDKSHKSEYFSGKQNFIGSQWWRIQQFIFTNMRQVEVYQAIKDLNILDGIIEYYNSKDPAVADIMKPMIYYGNIFIDELLNYAREHKIKVLSKEDIEEIKLKVRENKFIKKGLDENCDVEKWMNTLIQLYDMSTNQFSNGNSKNAKKI